MANPGVQQASQTPAVQRPPQRATPSAAGARPPAPPRARRAGGAIGRHLLASAVVLALAFGAALAYAVLTPPSYKSTGTLVLLSEEDLAFALVDSLAYADDVARQVGIEGDGEPLSAGVALRKRVDVELGARGTNAQDPPNVLRVTAHGRTGDQVRDLVDAYLGTLDTRLDILRAKVVADLLAPEQRTGLAPDANQTKAAHDYAANLTFYRVLDPASPPARTDTPDVVVLQRGAVLAVFLAVAAPFLIEAARPRS